MFKQITFASDGRYYINENGDVWNSKLNIIMKPYLNGGYLAVDLSCNGHKEKWLVHRLVATAFIPNPNNYPVVMHLDNNRQNPNVNNLKWGTYLENNKQSFDEGNRKIVVPDNRKLYAIYREDSPIAIIKLGKLEISKELNGINIGCIRNYIFRKTPIPHGKYKGWYITLFDNIR